LGRLRGKIAAAHSPLASQFVRLFEIAIPFVANPGIRDYLTGMKIFALVLVCGGLLVSCAPTTPQTRIENSPEKFVGLSQKHKALVRDGQIASGMPPAAVELAWGSPSRRFQGFKNQKASERWDYSDSRPVYTTSFYGGYGHGACMPYGRYGRRGYSTLGFGFGPEVEYIPEHVASVWFVGNRVDSWERVQ